MTTAPVGSDALGALRRWEASGATWTLRGYDGAEAIVDLVSCDGGAVVGRLASDDPAFLEVVLERPAIS